MDHAAMAASFRTVLEDIQSGGFARRYQEEERNGYPMLALAREIMHRTSGITADEDHVRHFSSGVTGRTDDKARNSAGCWSAQKTA
jgi:ketol-acid reductoisomerase